MANIQVFLAVPFEVGAPDDFIQSLQAFTEKLLAGSIQAGPPSPVLVDVPTGPPVVRQEPDTDVAAIAARFCDIMFGGHTDQQVALASAWMRCEKPAGQPSQWNNPFNTTMPGFNEVGRANSVGVRIYATLEDGLQANAATLKQQNMTDIRLGLVNGDAAAFVHGLRVDPWGTGPDCVASILGV